VAQLEARRVRASVSTSLSFTVGAAQDPIDVRTMQQDLRAIASLMRLEIT
jgi:hypothetical protein